MADAARGVAHAARGAAELAGRVAVVTGGSSGIGLATARLLADAGAHVVLVARGADRLERAAAELGAARVTPVVADVADEAGVSAVAEAVAAQTSHGPDVIVHAAGAFALAPLTECEVSEFDRMIAVNLRAAFLLIRAFVPAMLARGSGHVVTIGSVAGRQAFPSNGAYSASKFGVRGMHAVLSAELRGTGVRATFVEPAATDTPLWDDIDAASNPGLPPRAAMLPPDAVARAVLFALAQPADTAIPNILVERA